MEKRHTPSWKKLGTRNAEMTSEFQDAEFARIEQAARTFGLSYWQVTYLMRVGKLTRYRVGSRVVVRLDELRELLKPKKEAFL